jgi:hypothetical protein
MDWMDDMDNMDWMDNMGDREQLRRKSKSVRETQPDPFGSLLIFIGIVFAVRYRRNNS